MFIFANCVHLISDLISDFKCHISMWSQTFGPPCISNVRHNNSPVINIIAPARRISPLPEIIRANKEREVKRIKDSKREWEIETLWGWVMAFTHRLSHDLYSSHLLCELFPTLLMTFFIGKYQNQMKSLCLSWVNEFSKGIYSCSQALCCHTGVPLLMEYALLFLEYFEKHHLQFSLLEMNL